MFLFYLVIGVISGGMLSTIQIISCLRQMLRDMYIGNYGRHSVRKEEELYYQQRLKDRISLSYIRPYLVRRYTVDFDYYHNFYTVYCCSIVPIYLVCALIGYFFGFYPLIISLGIVGLINIIIVIKFRLYEFSDGFNTNSIYWNRK